ncbi:MAG TPA: HAD family hydrolase, partial [Candidatus Baltobacteraceae bacterium]
MARRVLNLVIFDCDGVLVDSEPLVNRIEADYFTALGAPMTMEQACARFKGKTVEQVATALASGIGRPLSVEFGYDWAMATALGLVEHLQPVPGVKDLIESVRAAGAAVCVASQSPLPRVRLSLHVTGLDRYFGEDVFTASMVGNPKPAPDLFLFAAQRMGISPQETAVIEDSPSGVVAARAAGMRVFG